MKRTVGLFIGEWVILIAMLFILQALGANTWICIALTLVLAWLLPPRW